MIKNNIFHFVGKSKGPKVVIMGGVHGNENLGVKIIEALKKLLISEDIHGEIYLVIANPLAVEQNVRFIHEDLNRLFTKEMVAKLQKLPLNQLNNEQKCLLKLVPILQQADFLLDLHSTIKPSIPFVFLENTPKHLQLAQILQPSYLVCNALEACSDLNTCADNFVDSYGGIGLTYETGWQQDINCFDEVLQKTQAFLQAVQVAFLDLPILPVKSSTPLLTIYQTIIPQSDLFNYVKDFKNFDLVKAGTVIAFDDKQKIIVNKDSHLLFVKTDIIKGKVAGYLVC